MRVLVVLLNYKTADMTIKALDALLPELRKLDDAHRAQGGAKVCIVDNDSQDGSYEKLAARGERDKDVVTVVASGHNGGYGFGNNVALRRGLAATGLERPDFFFLLNSDAFVEGPTLETLLAYMDEHPDVGMAGGDIHGTDGEPHTAAFTYPTLWSEIEGSVRLGVVTKLLRDRVVPRKTPAHDTDDVDWVPGASLIIRRQVLEQIGLFDETFFLYYEETDLCRRAKLAGFKVAFVKAASVAHIAGASTGVNKANTKKKRTPGFLLDSRRHYFLKHHGRAYLWAANVAYAAGLASYRVRYRVQGKNDPDYERALLDFVEHCVRHP